MIRVIIEYPDFTDSYGVLNDGTQVIEPKNDDELVNTLKDIYQKGDVNHVHLEFGDYDDNGMFKQKGEVTIPFEKDVTPFIALGKRLKKEL